MKIFTIILVIILFLALGAIGYLFWQNQKISQQEGSIQTTPSAEQRKGQVFAVGEDISLNDRTTGSSYSMKVLKAYHYDPSKQNIYSSGIREGMDILVVEITYENKSEGVIYYDPVNYQLTSSEGYYYQQASIGFQLPSPLTWLNSGSLIAGQKIIGVRAFQVPINTQEFQLIAGEDIVNINTAQ